MSALAGQHAEGMRLAVVSAPVLVGVKARGGAQETTRGDALVSDALGSWAILLSGRPGQAAR